jgi:cephalosporin hydroxylase
VEDHVHTIKGDSDFAPSLATFLALHTNESAEYLQYLIELFMRGAVPHTHPDSSVKNEIARRLCAEMEAQSNVPSFLHYYLQRRLILDDWPPQAAFVASRYLRRRIDDRFVSWQQRQQQVAELAHEPVAGSELGQAQLLYSQGAGPAFRWRGIPCFKTVYDLAIYAMLIDELRPATIIELGSGAGGSALLFADLCTSLGLSTQIISVDKEAVQELLDPRIAFIQSDCSGWLEATARSNTELKRPCFLVEDFHGELAGFVGHIDSILKAGDYLVIEDSNPKQSAIAQTIASLPYAVDTKYTDFFGINCTSAINSIFVKQA